MTQKKPVSILVADDDMDDCQMIREALQESRLLNELHFVHNGEDLIEFLEKSDVAPGLILLDLNMPRMDGREALKEIKSHPRFRQIPVVILTTSRAEEDVFRTYNLGVNSFITKPIAFDQLVNTMTTLGRYWFEVVELPKTRT